MSLTCLGSAVIVLLGFTPAVAAPDTEVELAAIRALEPPTLARALPADGRLTVVYWPDLSCSGCQSEVRRALSGFAESFPETTLITILPESFSVDLEGRLHFPGRALQVPQGEYGEAVQRLGLPRLEAWAQDGHLLLWRRLSLATGEGKRVASELEVSLIFTKPVEETP